MTACQRWRLRRDSYRPAGEVLRPSRYGVELIDSDSVARSFVVAHHYSGTYPAARCRVGLYRTSGLHQHDLVGVAVFSVPMSNAALRHHAGTTDAVELGRFVLLDEVPANGETWFLRRAFGLLTSAKPSIRAVLSYSDPVRRRSAAGALVLPGHVGTIYQAHNGHHTGRSCARTQWLDRSGRVVSLRALSKLRRDERGARCRFRHPGNLAYVWAVGAQKRATRKGFRGCMPYPKCPVGGSDGRGDNRVGA